MSSIVDTIQKTASILPNRSSRLTLPLSNPAANKSSSSSSTDNTHLRKRHNSLPSSTISSSAAAARQYGSAAYSWAVGQSKSISSAGGGWWEWIMSGRLFARDPETRSIGSLLHKLTDQIRRRIALVVGSDRGLPISTAAAAFGGKKRSYYGGGSGVRRVTSTSSYGERFDGGNAFSAATRSVAVR